MSGFHWRASDRFTVDELIAYHLGDLPPKRARSLRRALIVNAVLAAESAAIVEVLNAFPRGKELPVLSADELNNYWLAVRPHLEAFVPPSASTIPIHHRGWFRPFLVTGSAIVLATLGVLTVVHHHHGAQQADQDVGTVPRPALAYPRDKQPAGSERLGMAQQQCSSPAHKAIAAISRPYSSLGHTSSFEANPPANLTKIAPPEEDSANHAPARAHNAQLPTVASVTPADTPPAPTAIEATEGSVHSRWHHSHSDDLMLGISGNVIEGKSFNTASATTNGNDFHGQRATPAVGATVSFHQQFSPLVGYRVTVAYSRPSLDYTYRSATTPNAQPNSIEITTRAVELSGAYVALGPRHNRLHTSVEAGVGVLLFHPYQSGTSPNTVTRPTAIAGVGAELAVSQHVSLRAQYRALVFATPDFQNPTSAVPITSTTVVSSQPSVGITYRFDKSKSQ